MTFRAPPCTLRIFFQNFTTFCDFFLLQRIENNIKSKLRTKIPYKYAETKSFTFRLLIKHCNTKKFRAYDEPPTPSYSAPIILLSVPCASLVKGLERSFHSFSYYLKLTVRWWRWSRCIVTKFMLNRDYERKGEKKLFKLQFMPPKF